MKLWSDKIKKPPEISFGTYLNMFFYLENKLLTFPKRNQNVLIRIKVSQFIASTKTLKTYLSVNILWLSVRKSNVWRRYNLNS